MEEELLKPRNECSNCGRPMRARRENYLYDECGLRYVTLLGIQVHRCPGCGNYEVSIPRIEQLHRLIARLLIEKMTRFTGAEMRFLRKSLGLSSGDFARRMGVTVETVSRWEQNAVPVGPQADRLVRLLVAQGKLAMRYPEEHLALIDSKKSKETRLEIRVVDDRWSGVAA
jgi:putative zinc finger/helix-turn-helix YgiT family protein